MTLVNEQKAIIPKASVAPGRMKRGLWSTLSFPLNRWAKKYHYQLEPYDTPERREQGLILVLPGIEGESFFNHDVMHGLIDAGLPYAIEHEDWTTKRIINYLYHLRGWKRNVTEAERIVAKILAYQQEYPGRPVHLVGHSGGGAMSILVLERLPEQNPVESVVLLGPALSRHYDLTVALRRVGGKVWNFYSYLDWFFLILGTSVMGTLDGRHHASAGALGFLPPKNASPDVQELYATKLREVGYQWRMLRSVNFGGHFGCVNRLFIEEWVAPLLATGIPEAV
ncbi:MAG: DUF726 domain-containing protein [Planctomycetales bacterium]